MRFRMTKKLVFTRMVQCTQRRIENEISNHECIYQICIFEMASCAVVGVWAKT